MNKYIFFTGFVIILYLQINFNPKTLLLNNDWNIIHSNYKDSLFAKNKKALSAFTDTSVLNRHRKEIICFEKEDSLIQTMQIDIIFTGSSSIRKWEIPENEFSNIKFLNRGFGGSTLPEVIYFADILIFKHKPKMIVLYAGENDIASPKSDINKVIKSFIYFQKLVKQKLPESQLFFISLKPSPSRLKWWSQMESINYQIKLYCNGTQNCTFIDASTEMLDSYGYVRKELFGKDMLHLNEKGYSIWTRNISKALKSKINERL